MLVSVGSAVGAILQVTTTPSTTFFSAPSISGDGRYIVFTTNADVGGLNPSTVPNVFVYDLLAATFTRVTPDGGFDPVISSDGRWIAFTSGADYARRNLDGSDEIFRYDRVRRRFYQLTRDLNGDGSSALPAINATGNRVAFETTSNLRGRNPDFTPEIFLFSRSGNFMVTRDLFEGEGESHQPAINGEGKMVAFVSTSNLTGRNPDLSQELFFYDLDQRDVDQITNDVEGFGESSSPAVSGDGRFVTFISSSNVAGLNPDGVGAVYLRGYSGHYTVITNTPDGLFDGDAPTISDDGRFIAFVSGANVTLGNPDHNAEILLFDRIRKTFTQITDSAGCSNVVPKISGHGGRITFQSRCNLTGANADGGREVFVADNPSLNLVLHSEGPVSLSVTDPNGLAITANGGTIPNATYAQGDFDSDLVPEDLVTIPQAAEGRYLIHVIPDAGALPSDMVSVTGTLNAIDVPLASDTVATLSGVELSFGNQGFLRRVSRMTPLAGVGSRLYLAARLGHRRAAAGPIKITYTDGSGEQVFDCGQIENLGIYGSFHGTVDGFDTKLRIANRPDGTTSVSLLAKDGDLSEFDTGGDINMVMIVQAAYDTDMHNWRFKRNALSGKLYLK